MVSVLTCKTKGIADKIITPITVKDVISQRQIQTNGLWDTGATSSAITKKAAQQLGLPAIAKTYVRGVHGVNEVNVYYIEIVLNNPKMTIKCKVTECNELSNSGNVDMLLGMNVISRGDFHISNFGGNTTMTFRVPSMEETDYVSELKEYAKYFKIHEVQSKKGIEKCPCGSGKAFKNCHGKSIYHNK